MSARRGHNRIRTARGQGTVELALGLLVFLTVLFFGIHFAEVGMMKLRVQQSATSALWDTTGLRMHRFNTDVDSKPDFYSSNQMRDARNRAPAQAAEARFHDFEGLSAQGGPTTFTQVMTRGSRLEVSCEPTRVAPLPTRGKEFERLRAAYTPARAGGTEVDGMECNARARLEVWGMPKHLFRKHLPSADRIRQSKSLGLFGEILGDPGLWHLNRRSLSGAVFIGTVAALLPMPFHK